MLEEGWWCDEGDAKPPPLLPPDTEREWWCEADEGP